MTRAWCRTHGHAILIFLFGATPLSTPHPHPGLSPTTSDRNRAKARATPAWATFGGQANNATIADSTETPARQLPGTEETNPMDLVTPEGSPVVPRRIAL